VFIIFAPPSAASLHLLPPQIILYVMDSQYVLHHHTGHGAEHWDFMVLVGDSLATWQLDTDPRPLSPGQSITARKLADHRIAYLDYQGPVSRQRGLVVRKDRGRCRLLETSADLWGLELSQGQLRGHWRIARQCDDTWILYRLVEP
jgi:hypothetical protein